MKTPVWSMLVDMLPMMVYMVLVRLVVWPVLMTVVRMPVLVLPPPELLPVVMMLVVSHAGIAILRHRAVPTTMVPKNACFSIGSLLVRYERHA
jgi:hypothetical protein